MQGKLEGVWKVVEVTFAGPNARTVTNPQPGLFIFAKKHYSMTYVAADAVRPDQLPRDASDAQKVAAWEPFFGYAGEYEVNGTTATFHTKISKNAASIAPNSGSVQDFRIEGNTLWLTQRLNNNRPISNPVTVKFVRVE